MQFIFQKKSLILSIIFFIFSCFVFVFLYKNIINNKDVSQSSHEEWQREAIQKENTKSIIDSINVIAKERTELETHFIKSSDIVSFLDTIEKLAKEVGLKYEVSSVDVSRNDSSLAVVMKTLGNFESTYKLITLLENSQYDIEFTSVGIQNLNTENMLLDKNSKNPQWVATFQIKLKSFINEQVN